jgi:hypothetical protein
MRTAVKTLLAAFVVAAAAFAPAAVQSNPVVVGAGAPPIIRDLIGDTCPSWGCGMNSNQTLLS